LNRRLNTIAGLMALVEARAVGKTYESQGAPVVALRDISFSVERAEFVALIGRSGCGKTTLLNLCGAMDFPSSGDLAIDGESTSRLADAALTRLRREKVGFIFQSFQLLHTLSAVENVELPLLLSRQPQARVAALERLRWVEMEAYAERLPHQLSGGQQQRVAIARSLVHSPRLLLADEPTGNLDTSTGDTVLALLQRTAREQGVAVMLATHSLESASVADRIFKMRDGHIESITTP
jgi:putative ABC transport system ATP-binding protein